MSYTYTVDIGDGVKTVFPFSFAGQDEGYLSVSNIQVFVAGVSAPFTILSNDPNKVYMASAPPLGAEVLIRRIMPKNVPYSDFSRGNPFSQDTLNDTNLQMLYVIQEILDGFLPDGFYFKGDLNMGGHKVINMAPGSSGSDAINFAQFQVEVERNDEQDQRLEAIESSIVSNVGTRTVPYYYIATGGEVRWQLPIVFTSALLFINGVFQNQNLGAFSISGNGFNFAEPLVKGDEVYALLGSGAAAPDDYVTVDELNHRWDVTINYNTPEYYGAVGDGITDDTQAMQDAINASSGKTLEISQGRKYRCKNLTIPHAMTLHAGGRRQGGGIIPFGNSGSFTHTGDFIKITAEDSVLIGSTVTFINVTIDARGVPLTKVDGQRLNGLVQTDNTSGSYRSGFQLYNCNVSGFSGLNILCGKSRSFGIIKDTQSESSDLSCCRVEGVDWRIDHSYFGRSGTGYGIEILNESNVVSHCDFYFNKKSGVLYQQVPGKGFFKMIACTSNSNGEHGVSCVLPYNQPSGIMITQNRFWNNSTSADGTYHNIDLSYGRGHVIIGNIHEAYQAASGSTSARAGYCINLRNGAQPAHILDTYDDLWSYRTAFCNLNTQNEISHTKFKIGSAIPFIKGMASDTSIGASYQVNSEAYPSVVIFGRGIKIGNGTSDPVHGLTHNSSYPNCTVAIKGIAVTGGFEDTYLRVGGHYFWQNDSLIMTNRGQPTSISDGKALMTRKVTPPTSATDSGNTGDFAIASGFLYVCVAFNTWKRVALATW